ncbi:MAG: hypothetical protein BWX84_00778 [Verrucomicrobia bacterium ADurb.Bin118]|nr:MAG: hypothetical protein BWX84_00778 [Verrucomicrobia bacterium ADurb.Bin118]
MNLHFQPPDNIEIAQIQQMDFHQTVFGPVQFTL